MKLLSLLLAVVQATDEEKAVLEATNTLWEIDDVKDSDMGFINNPKYDKEIGDTG